MKFRLTLKSRFTLVAAGAVAAVALAITAVAFLAIRTDLQNQVQQEVATRAESVKHLAKQFHGGRIPSDWVPPHSSGFGAHLHPGDHLGRRRLGTARRPGPAHAKRGGDRRGGGRCAPFYAVSDIAGRGRWC